MSDRCWFCFQPSSHMVPARPVDLGTPEEVVMSLGDFPVCEECGQLVAADAEVALAHRFERVSLGAGLTRSLTPEQRAITALGFVHRLLGARQRSS